MLWSGNYGRENVSIDHCSARGGENVTVQVMVLVFILGLYPSRLFALRVLYFLLQGLGRLRDRLRRVLRVTSRLVHGHQ